MKGKHTMEEYEVISIPVSDGTERDFAIMDTFEFEGQGYLAVSLIEGDEIQEGVNNIPLDRCAEKGIVVFNTPGANANAVKELVLAGLLLSARNIPRALSWASSLTENVSAVVEKGKSQFAGREISGKTLGVVGLGAIGRKVASSAHALGMNIAGYDPYLKEIWKTSPYTAI